jgi:site-specific recombinase XerD
MEFFVHGKEILMVSARIDGTQITDSLLHHINAEDGIGAGLAQRTREDYARKMSAIANRIEKNGQGRLSPITLVDYMEELIESRKIAQSTARSMKAAAIFWLAEEGQSLLAQDIDLFEYEKAFKAIRALSTKDLPKNTQETSSTKLKCFTKETLESLIEYANKTPRATNAGTLIAF